MSNTCNVYSEIELTTDVMTASNHRLISLLFDKCMRKMESAKHFIGNRNIEKKGECIQGALDILQYLRHCLNHQSEKSKDLAAQLDSIYTYAQRKLMDANMQNEVAYLNDAQKVIAEVQSGWDGMRDKE
jgi:flagellar secretion chaperone FliS